MGITCRNLSDDRDTYPDPAEELTARLRRLVRGGWDRYHIPRTPFWLLALGPLGSELPIFDLAFYPI